MEKNLQVILRTTVMSIGCLRLKEQYKLVNDEEKKLFPV